MPLIPFPDVPNAPGVPFLPRQGAPALVRSPTGAPTPIVEAPSWQIVDSTGATLLTPDSVIEFEYRGEMRVCDYPVEQGGFESYNKVAVPFDIRMLLACNGQGAMTRQAFLGTLLALREALTLITVVTPDDTYQNCNLAHVDYRRHARSGVSLLLAHLWLQEIRSRPAASVTTAQPDGAAPQKIGQVSPTPPTVAQQSQFDVTVIPLPR